MEVVGDDACKVFQVMKIFMWPTEKTGPCPKSCQKLPNVLNQCGVSVIVIFNRC